MTFVLLGILNAQAAGAGVASDFELLETQTLGTAAASVTFTGLDSYTDYKHLQIRMNLKSDRSSTVDGLVLRLNSDTGSNYAFHQLEGDGSSVSSGASTSQNYMQVGLMTANSVSDNETGVTVSDILDFSSTSKNTTVRSVTGVVSTFIRIRLFSGLWNDTSAVTNIELFTNNAQNFIAGSRFSLFGIKAGA